MSPRNPAPSPTRVAAIALIALASAIVTPGAVATAAPGARTAGLVPAAAPAPSPTKTYDCLKLISLAQLRKATGLADATYVKGKSTGLPKGETYCQFLARQGATSIALSVWTGPSRKSFDLLWDAGASAQPLPGIGDAARVSVRDGTGGARVGGTGIGLVLKETGTGGLKGVNVKTAIAKVLAIVAKRV